MKIQKKIFFLGGGGGRGGGGGGRRWGVWVGLGGQSGCEEELKFL